MKTVLLYPYPKRLFTGCNPPISLLYLGAALENVGQEVTILDVDEWSDSEPDFVQRTKAESPDLVGIPLFSSTLSEAYSLINRIRSEIPSCTILVGGPHSTVRWEEVLNEFNACDFVLRGESEGSIVDLVQTLEQGKSVRNVQGLSYRQNKSLKHNPDAIWASDLDTIALPARHLLKAAYEKKTYWRIGHRGTTDVMITSRGCPYNCNFCFRISKKYRTRSPENILAELAMIRDMGTRSVHVMDDLFVWNKPRFLRIVQMIKKQKLDLELKVRARVNFIDDEMLSAMKEAGVRGVVFGVESGSQEMLDRMNKRTTVEMNENAIRMTKKAGLQCYVDLFLGYPGETPETIKQTEHLLLKARPTAANIAVMYPLPGTHVYEEAKRAGTLMDDWSIDGALAWIKLDWFDHISEIHAYRKRMLRKFLRHPLVIWNGLRATLFRIDLRQLKVLFNYFFRLKEI